MESQVKLFFDSARKPSRMVGISRDITSWKTASERLAVQYAVTRLLAESPTLDAATPKLLQAICESLGWQFGAIWRAHETDGTLRCVDTWKVPDASLTPFESVTRDKVFASGTGLPGRVLRTGEAVWIADVTTDDNFPRAPQASSVGLHGAFGFPILAGKKVLGVIEFFNREILEPDRSLLEMIGTLGSLIGQFIERKLAQAERERLLGALRAEREGLKAAKDAADAANRAKDQFLAALSHELRTPLTPVLAAVAALEESDGLDRECRSWVAMMRRNIELEARLIDDLLDLTRIARRKLKLDFETVDVHELIRLVMETCSAEIVAKKLHVTRELMASLRHVRADPARLQQVLWNLIKNAIKFTPEEGSIGIQTEDAPGCLLEVRISDTGMGIEKEVLPRLFFPFEQGEESIPQRFGGLGLGLAISKALVEAHGGTLRAESPGKGMGATFALRVPASKEPAPEAVPVRSRESDGAKEKPLRILLVEDHQDTARVLTRLLEKLHYDVRSAGTVESALEAAEEEPFDVLISDVGLPDGSGRELMSLLRARGLRKGIALSGYGMDADVRKSKDAGFLEHLTKPIDFQKLLAAIERISV
jgi:signal transduction histidine kinase/CheY-like chemotaxis protein